MPRKGANIDGVMGRGVPSSSGPCADDELALIASEDFLGHIFLSTSLLNGGRKSITQISARLPDGDEPRKRHEGQESGPQVEPGDLLKEAQARTISGRIGRVDQRIGRIKGWWDGEERSN
ncbi:hypothetical protein DFH09DRAFT_1097214 [Mycena vulgaris]|nr:hypothetical protein DFH09DRAFT_1113725 [Mycena vulgaris]KAJ6522322.1 hypothetical protein DFH09DRAFT_1097214 [Mycena vulgaris]